LKWLNKYESDFLKALDKDYINKGKNSFLDILFCVSSVCKKNILSDILEDVENENHKIFFKNSDIIFRSQDSFYLGKYKEHYFIYGNEGEFFGAGKEIQNVCNVFRELFYGYSEEDTRAIESIFKMHKYPPYEEVIEDYKIFCSNLHLKYETSDIYWETQSEEFDEVIELLILD